MSAAFTKMVGIPALIMVALSVPNSGTVSSSTRLPVGNMSPSPSAGSINSTLTSAAGNVTPSSSKLPVSCTSPLVIGTCTTISLLILTCQTRTTATPFCGILSASTRPLLIANAPTAAVKLPQLPLQSTKALSIAT